MVNIQVEQNNINKSYMIDGHIHLENGPLEKDYVYQIINEAVNKGIDEIQILDHTHRFLNLPHYMKTIV